jgi:hypothetical protein
MDYLYDAFISFSWKDMVRARRLHEQLSERGYVTWYAEKDARAGDRLGPVIEKGLVQSRYVFILHTKYYDGNTGWAARELELSIADEINRGTTKIVVLKYDQAPLFSRLEGRVYVDFTDRRRKPLDQLTALLDEASEGVIRGVGRAMREATDINEIRDCAHRLSGFARRRREHLALDVIAGILLSQPASYHVGDSAAWALGDIAVWTPTPEFVEDVKAIVPRVVATGDPRLIGHMAYICGEMAAHATDAGLMEWAREFIERNAASTIPAVRDPFVTTIERIRELRHA